MIDDLDRAERAGTVPEIYRNLHAYEIARDFAIHLGNLFEVRPTRFAYEEHSTTPTIWTTVTVVLPRLGEAAYMVDGGKEGPDAMSLYWNSAAIPVTWMPGLSVGWMLARAIDKTHKVTAP